LPLFSVFLIEKIHYWDFPPSSEEIYLTSIRKKGKGKAFQNPHLKLLELLLGL